MLKLYFNRKDSVEEFLNSSLREESILVFGFNGVDTISYKKELSGEENNLSNVAKLSRKDNKVVLSGAITDNYGIIRKSCLVADSGKLLGISDMNFCLDRAPYSSGSGHRIYQTKSYRIGVLVDDDIYDIDSVKSMALLSADIIICIVESQEKQQFSVLARAYSYLFGLPVVICSSSGIIAGDMKGEICGSSFGRESSIIVPIKKNYRNCQFKKRGIKG
jgi:predicted amidohydrolase